MKENKSSLTAAPSSSRQASPRLACKRAAMSAAARVAAENIDQAEQLVQTILSTFGPRWEW